MGMSKRAKEVHDWNKKKDQTYGGHERGKAFQLLQQIYDAVDAGRTINVAVVGKVVTFSTRAEVDAYFRQRAWKSK